MGVVPNQSGGRRFGNAHLCGNLRHRFVLRVIEPLGQTHPFHLVLAQGHDAQVGLQIAIHPPTQEGIEIGGQLPSLLVIAAGLETLPQFQVSFSAQILQQCYRCGIFTPKAPGRVQGDGPDEVLQLAVELFKGIGVTAPHFLIQVLIRHKPPPPLLSC